MEKKEKLLKVVYVVVLFLLGGGLIFWGLNGGGYWPLIIGVFFTIAFIVNLVRVWYELKTGDCGSEDFSATQGVIGCFVPAALFVAFLVFDLKDIRYISPHGDRLHINRDCSSLQASSDIREITRLEGWFHWVFKDCKVCEERKDAENEAKRIERRKNRAMKTRQELIEYYEEKLEYVQEKLDKLKNCEDPDEIFKEEKIMEANEYPEEYDDDDAPPAGLPSRYW